MIKSAIKLCRHLNAQIAFNINYSTNLGNSALRSENLNSGLPHRWKKVWVLSMKRKAEIEGPEPPLPRSNQRNWNYKAELAAFQCRLDLECQPELLSVAFSDPLPSFENGEQMQGNRDLHQDGWMFAEMFISHYVDITFPHMPEEGKKAISKFLLRQQSILTLVNNLGYKELLQSAQFPPSYQSLFNCFFAVLQAINMCQGPVAAGRFLLDFVMPQLIGKDILDHIWKPTHPMCLLTNEMEKQKRPLPEARLLRQSGVNTVTPVFYVALFSGKDVLAESGGESIPLAETDAAKLALKKIYKIENSSKPVPMGHRVDDDFLSRLFEPLLASHNEKTNILHESNAQ